MLNRWEWNGSSTARSRGQKKGRKPDEDERSVNANLKAYGLVRQTDKGTAYRTKVT